MQMDMDQGGLLAEVKAVMGPGDSTQTCFRREKRGPRWLAGGRPAKSAWCLSWHTRFWRFCAATMVSQALESVEQDQDDDAHPDRQDRQHDDKLLAIHTYVPST